MNLDNLITAILAAALFIALAGIAVYALFLRTLQRALERCAPQNRTVQPGQVWLGLIPLFNIVWQFILVARIAESLRREFATRQAAFAAPEDDYGNGLGMAMCALSLTSIIPYLGILTGLAGLICWIVYWVRISGYSQTLEAASAFPTTAPAPAWEPPPPAEAPAPGSGWPILLVLMLGHGAIFLQHSATSALSFDLKTGLHLSYAEMGWIFSAYSFGLMAGYVLMTLVTALAGTRWGAIVSLAGMSIATSATGLTQNLAGLIALRALQGLFVAGLLPAAIQAVREWFPTRLRPLAIGLFLAAGHLVYAMASPSLAWGFRALGWHTGFLLAGLPAGAAAVLCIVLWPARTPREPSRGVSGAAIASAAMLGVGLFLTAPVTWFLTAWLPIHVMRGQGHVASMVFSAAAACGAVAAGAIAWGMISGGTGAARARAVVLTGCGAILPLAASAAFVPLLTSGSAPFLPLLIGVCSAAYLGWSTLLYSAVADILPARGVAVGAAIGALMGSLSGMLAPMASNLMGGAEGGTLVPVGVAAAAAVALLVVALLAWLAPQEQVAA